MKKLLPQANSIDKIIDSFIFIANYSEYTSEAHANFCNFNPRQSAYYANACYYLDLIDENKKLTEFGLSIINSKRIKQGVLERIFEDDIFNKLYARYIFEGKASARRFGFDLLSKTYFSYSEDVIKRRLSTLLAWCDQISLVLRKKLN